MGKVSVVAGNTRFLLAAPDVVFFVSCTSKIPYRIWALKEVAMACKSCAERRELLKRWLTEARARADRLLGRTPRE